MLNVGPLELLVVLAVALVVVGPERLPELARSVGRVLRQFREVQDEVRSMVSSEVNDDMREAADEFKKVTGGIRQATDVKGAVRRAERTIRDETATPRKPRTTPAVNESGEVGGAPADRLVEDAAAGPPTHTGDTEPETEPDTETETPPRS
jgi:sec-independent protein translocase protein TatB